MRKRMKRSALLIVDMISDFEFDDGAKLSRRALPVAKRIVVLRKRMHRAGLPVIYVNDNYGKWQEDFTHQVRRMIEQDTRGREIAELLKPMPDEYYVLKPQRSGFYETPLDVLLVSLDVERLIVTGVTTDICVLFTAHDAYMRGYEVVIPKDCTAAVENSHHKIALHLLKRSVKARIPMSRNLLVD